MRTLFAVLILVAASAALVPPDAAAARYAWRNEASPPADTLSRRIAPPPGFARVPVGPDSFAAWLRDLPLKPAGTPVLLHSGVPKFRQDVHAAVVDIDVGQRNLQQCADAVMRLRAEWLYGAGRTEAIAFNDTGAAKPMSYARWADGDRPRPSGRGLSWSRNAKPDNSYASFRRYMDTVFMWAGTHSLERELKPVPVAGLAAGDVFIKGGFPGHAVLVVDVVANAAGEKRFLLLQSYMPAQDMHILTNPDAADGSPWYRPDFGAQLRTPEWVFARDSLRRWP